MKKYERLRSKAASHIIIYRNPYEIHNGAQSLIQPDLIIVHFHA